MMIAIATAALLATTGTTPTADPLVTSADPQSIITALQSAGYTVSPDHQSNGDPSLNVARNNAAYLLNFHDCVNNAGCKLISFSGQFASVKTVTPQVINDKYYRIVDPAVSFYTNSSGALEFDVEALMEPGGMSRSLFLATVDRWITAGQTGRNMLLAP